MGGKALKSIDTQRLGKKDYERVKKEVTAIVRGVMGVRPRIDAIEAYRTKEDFGDLDLLVEDFGFALESIQTLADRMGSREHVVNNNVVSFDYQGFQVDLILTVPEVYASSKAYFAWNDLGNLMGRIADSAGLKFGWDGLIYRIMDKTEKVEDIVVTRDPSVAIHFLGYDSQRHAKGFDTVEEIYKFAASSPHFHPDLYLLENRNAQSRVRDAKRKTYTGFLQWLQSPDGLTAYHQEVSSSHGGWRQEDKAAWLHRLRAEFPSCREALDRAWAERAKLAVFKTHFNGENVAALTGLTHRALGQFMDDFRDKVASDSGLTFRGWALHQTQESIERSLKAHMDRTTWLAGTRSP